MFITTNVTATAGDTQAAVSFTAPASDGASPITGYTVTSDPAGGVDIDAGTTALTHTITGLTNGTAYTFTVIATNAVGTSLASSASNSVTPRVPTYTVTYNDNGSTGGSVPVDGNSYTTGTPVTVLGNTGSLVKIGYTFTGWNSAADGSGISFAGGSIFAIGSYNVTLYAQWTLIPTYSVTYNGNTSSGGSVPVDGNAYAAGATVTVLGNTGSLVKSGYTFTGWNSAANGSGTGYVGGATFAMGSANVTLYAQWTLIPTYSVTYSGNTNTAGTVPIDGNTYANGA